MFVNRHNQNRVTRIQKFFGKLEPLFHHRKPFAVPIFVARVDIIVVIFPIACAGVIRRVNVNAINLAAVKIFEQLERVIVIRLNERVPERGIGCVTDGIERLKIRINRIAELSNADYFVLVESQFLTVRNSDAKNFVADNFRYSIKFVKLAGFSCDERFFLYGHIVKRGAFGILRFEDQSEFLCSLQRGNFFLDTPPQIFVGNFLNQII